MVLWYGPQIRNPCKPTMILGRVVLGTEAVVGFCLSSVLLGLHKLPERPEREIRGLVYDLSIGLLKPASASSASTGSG